ncbi:hypothetical protein FOZ63_007403, partial [Perkinsus olseni]
QAVLLEEAEGETRELVPPRSVVAGLAEEDLRGPSDESVTRLVLPPDAGYVSPEHFRIFPLGDDFYVQDFGSDYGITVDGLRYRSTDGPIGPLKDGSIISIGGGSQHAPPMFLCEFNTPEKLRKRRHRATRANLITQQLMRLLQPHQYWISCRLAGTGARILLSALVNSTVNLIHDRTPTA